MLDKRTKKILNFLKEIEKLKLVLRIPYLSDQKRRENDAEHSWHLAIMVLAFEKELSLKFDVAKAIKLALVHDLGEIYIGDGWYSTKEAKAQKMVSEEKATKKVFNLLPNDTASEFFNLWREYEDGITIESKVVKALDKITYPLQYSIGQKIEYDKKVTIADSRKYAIPTIKFDPKLIEILESLYQDMPKYHDPENK